MHKPKRVFEDFPGKLLRLAKEKAPKSDFTEDDFSEDENGENESEEYVLLQRNFNL